MAERFKVDKSDAEWRKQLTPDQYRVTREHGTERAWTHLYNTEKRAGIYHCVACGAALVTASAKYECGWGWARVFAPLRQDAVGESTDNALFMTRTEVHCATCGAHLGHVFPDGPQPTGLRYCMNGTALDFEAKE